MDHCLFAYGTLLPDRAPDPIAGLVERLRPMGEGVVCGQLYDFGEYPGAILDESGKPIYGTIFQLPDDEGFLRELDRYEGFDPADVSASLFLRQLQPVTLTSGQLLHCWVYVYNRNPERAPVIASGRYLKKE